MFLRPRYSPRHVGALSKSLLRSPSEEKKKNRLRSNKRLALPRGRVTRDGGLHSSVASNFVSTLLFGKKKETREEKIKSFFDITTRKMNEKYTNLVYACFSHPIG